MKSKSVLRAVSLGITILWAVCSVVSFVISATYQAPDGEPFGTFFGQIVYLIFGFFCVVGAISALTLTISLSLDIRRGSAPESEGEGSAPASRLCAASLAASILIKALFYLWVIGSYVIDKHWVLIFPAAWFVVLLVWVGLIGFQSGRRRVRTAS